MTLLVVDLSNNNGDLRPIVRAAHQVGVRAGIFKITEGVGFLDTRAQAGIDEARRHKWACGGYHFMHSEEDPRAQARLFVEHAHDCGLWHKGDIRPQLDFETGSYAHASPERDAFYNEVYHRSNHYSGLYTGGYFNLTGWLPARRRQRALWVAGYPTYHQPAGYGAPWLHQWTDRYRLPGGYLVDMSRVQGTWPHARLRMNVCRVSG